MPLRHHKLLLAFVLGALVTTSAGCSQRQPTQQQLLSRANEAFASDQYAEAEKGYREVLRAAPSNPTALRQLGIIYYEQGQLLQAQPLLRQAAEVEPDNEDVKLRLGLTYLSLGNYAQAREAAEQILQKEPANERALVLLAGSAVSPEDVEGIRQLIENLRQDKDKDGAGYHLALGMSDIRKKDLAGAESKFQAALAQDPRSSLAYIGLATVYWARNDLKAAAQAFKTAADFAPPRSAERLRYVEFLIKTGAVTEAKTILEDLSRKLPDYLPPRVLLMKMACAEHQDDDCTKRIQGVLTQDSLNYDALLLDATFDLAKSDAVQAIRKFEYLSNTYTRNPLVRFQLALAYLLSAKEGSPVQRRAALDKAESNLSDATRLDPHFEQAILQLAQLKIMKGSPAAAIGPLVQLTKERPQVAQAYYLLASAYLAQQDKTQALAIYNRMTELFPQDPQPQFQIGTILLEQGRRQDARIALEKSAEISPDYLAPLDRLVDLDIVEKQYETAMKRAQNQIDKTPNEALPRVWRAKIYRAQSDLPRAEADLLKATELDPGLEMAYLLLADIYVTSGKPEQAIERLSAFAQKDRSVRALIQLALIHQRLGHFAAARDTYEKLLTVQPNSLLALNNLATLYSDHLKQPDMALTWARKAKELYPTEPHVADSLGWILLKRGDYGNALQLLRDSARQLSGRPEVQYHLGIAHYMLGEEEASRVALQQAIDSADEFEGKVEARRQLAILAIDVAKANVAVRAELENYLRERPADPVALFRLAELQERDGVEDQAIKTYEKIIDGNPLFAPAVRRAVLLYSKRSDDDKKAYELAQKARQAYPQDAEVAKALGLLSYRRELYPRAEELLREAVAKKENDWELLYYLGQTHFKLKQWKECQTVLGRAVAVNNTAPLANDARRTLAECSEMVSP